MATSKSRSLPRTTARASRFVFCALSLLPGFSLLVRWLAFDTAYPRSDPGEYFFHAQDALLKFKLIGILEGIERAWVSGFWKPTATPVFILPALILTQGHVRPASILFSVAFYLLCVIYGFLIFENLLDSKKAILPTMAIGTLPWLLFADLRTFSEAPALAFMMAAIFHTLRFREKPKALIHGLVAGIFWGALLSVRVVEGAMLLFFATVWLLDRIRWDRAFGATLAGGILLLCTRWLRVDHLPMTLLVYATCLLPMLIVYLLSLRKRGGGLPASWPYFLGLTASAFLWFAPRVQGVFEWIKICTYSDFAAKYGGKSQYTLGQFLRLIFERYLTLQHFTVIGLALLIALAYQLKAKKSPLRLTRPQILSATCFGLSVLFPILLGATTNNGDLRYYIYSFLILLLGLFLGLARLGKPGLIVLGLLALSQWLGFNLQSSYGPSTLGNLIPKALLSQPQSPFTYNPIPGFDPSRELVRQVTESSPESFKSSPVVEYVELNFNSPYSGGIEQWALTIAMRERIPSFVRFDRSDISELREDWVGPLRTSLSHHPFVLVSPVSVDQIPHEANDYSTLQARLKMLEANPGIRLLRRGFIAHPTLGKGEYLFLTLPGAAPRS